jgi:hypothetical protein
MKSKYGFLSAAFVAASVLLGSGEASAGGNGWWGRVGYGSLRVREVNACIDTYTASLRVAIRAPGAGFCNDLAVSANLWGDAVCLMPAPVPGPAYPLPPPPVLVDDCYDGVLLPLPPPLGAQVPVLPPPVGAQLPVVPPVGAQLPGLPPVGVQLPGPIAQLVSIDGFSTHGAIAERALGNWFYADFDLFHLFEASCGAGYMEDMRVGLTTIFIDGRPFVLDYELPNCDADWGL